MLVLVTRDAASARRTAQAVEARGHRTLCDPLTRIVAVPHEPFPASVAAILLTSPNAAEIFAPEAAPFLQTPVLAVGERTAEAATGVGFTQVHSANGDAQDLLALVRARIAPGAILAYPAPAHAARDLGLELGGDGYAVITRIIYRIALTDALAEATKKSLRDGQIGAVLHFSKTAVLAYLQLTEAAGVASAALLPEQLCLSHRIAAPLKEHGARVRVAEKPNESALIALVEG